MTNLGWRATASAEARTPLFRPKSFTVWGTFSGTVHGTGVDVTEAKVRGKGLTTQTERDTRGSPTPHFHLRFMSLPACRYLLCARQIMIRRRGSRRGRRRGKRITTPSQFEHLADRVAPELGMERLVRQLHQCEAHPTRGLVKLLLFLCVPLCARE